MKKIIDFLISSEIEYEENVSGKRLTSFCVGGNVKTVIRPRDKTELRKLFLHLKKSKTRHILLGRGSNVVIDDEGYNGAVIILSAQNEISIDGEILTAGAGATLRQVAAAARDNCLSGLEFAHGIPGSVGGGVYMNAGAYGGEISGILLYCDCYDTEQDEFVRLEGSECLFSYRHSIFMENKNLVVLSATFGLSSGSAEEITKKMEGFRLSRTEKQPLEYPSAGSTFKRPENNFAGKLIEDAGLKGVSIGGAQISEKHAGFIINRGGATSEDIRDLVDFVRKDVNERFGVMLECEIEFVSNEEAFSDSIKRDFAKEMPHKTCCRRALAYGLLFDAFVSGESVHIDVRKPEFAEYYVGVLSKQLSRNVKTERIKKLGKRYFRISLESEAVAQRIAQLDTDVSSLADYMQIKCDMCRVNFLRGVFFARASFTSSAGDDHLEFRIQHEKRAELLGELLTRLGAEPKRVLRKGAVGLYYKKADKIENVLNLLFANNAFFEIMNRKIRREIAIQEHRATNCEAVNIKKQVETARKHLQAIDVIREAGLLSRLDSELTESIRLRLENDAASLSELAAMHEPPISKSVLNNRFAKIMKIAQRITESKN